MKNLKYFYTFLLQILLIIPVLPQSFYRSMADVDSFAYVTMDDKILILKRDESNELKFVDSISFAVTHRSDNWNTAIVIDDYLLVSAKDSVVLFSISDRENPLELDRINVSSIIRINNFGDYCFVYTSSNSKLLGIENDSLKLLNTHPRTVDGSPYYYNNLISLSYPYILFLSNNFDNYLITEKYYFEQNNFVITDSIQPPALYFFNGMISNSSNIFTLEMIWNGSAEVVDWYRYELEGDSIINRTRLCHLYTDWPPWVMQNFQLNDNFGIGPFENGTGGLSISNSNNPCSNLEMNINYNSTNYFTIGNSVYRIGDEGLYYLHHQGTFHKFQFPPVSVENDYIPQQILLEQNYPNPFNPTTRIQYTVSSRELVTLKVYDVLGREIATLVNEEKHSGVYEVEFQSSVGSRLLASGIYYYQLIAGDFIETKKMILIK